MFCKRTRDECTRIEPTEYISDEMVIVKVVGVALDIEYKFMRKVLQLN